MLLTLIACGPSVELADIDSDSDPAEGSSPETVLNAEDSKEPIGAAVDTTPTGEVIGGGSFAASDPEQSIAGYFEIRKQADRSHVIYLPESFSTSEGPDLHVVLSPRPFAENNDDNATQGSAIIAKLTSLNGAQAYSIPEFKDPAAFKSVLIHCVKYSHLYGGADLSLVQ
jgi:hypothetical protein